MPSAMHLIKHMDLHHGVDGVGGVVLETAAGAAASYGIGQAFTRYRDKWYGKHAPTLAAGIGKLGAVLLTAFAGRHHVLAGLLNEVGQAGVNAKFLQMGIEHALKSKNQHVAVLPAGADTKGLPAGSEIVVGDLGSAAAGRGLSFDQIEELATMH